MKSDNGKTTDFIIVMILLAATLLLKVGIVSNTWAISTDSAKFIRMSDDIKAGNLDAAIVENFHLLMPLLMAGVSSLFGINSEAAGTFVAVIFGTLAVAPLYFIGKMIWNRLAGAFAALAWATHFYIMRETADIMSDGLNMAFVLAAVWLCLWALRSRRPALLLLCGAAAGLAYLARPEGMGAVLVAAAYVLISRKFGWSARRKIAGVACALLAAAAVAAPYVYKISNTPKGFDLQFTPKKPLRVLLGLGRGQTEENDKATVDRELARLRAKLFNVERRKYSALEQVGATGYVFIEVYGPYLALALLGLLFFFVAKPRPQPGTALLVGTCIFCLAVVALLAINLYSNTTPSRRHVMPAVAATLPLCGAGLAGLLGGIAAFFRRKFKPGAALAVSIAICILILAGSAVVGLRPRRMEEMAQRIAAEEIRAYGLQSPLIMTRFEKIAYYAGGRQEGFPNAEAKSVTPELLLKYAHKIKADFIAVSDEEIAAFPFLAPENVEKDYADKLEFVVRADAEAVKERFGLDLKLKDVERMTVYRVIKQ